MLRKRESQQKAINGHSTHEMHQFMREHACDCFWRHDVRIKSMLTTYLHISGRSVLTCGREVKPESDISTVDRRAVSKIPSEPSCPRPLCLSVSSNNSQH
jgi:hypothetical protein